jgi:tRNA (cytidine/uridine-2'-O-)-methyltransferase
MAATLAAHHLSIALFQPQIAPNTGNIARLCVATSTALHLVRPLGFVLSDRNLRRSAMDYWPRLKLTVHDDSEAFFAAMGKTPLWFLTSKAERSLWDVPFSDGDCLVFGNESQGLSETLRGGHPDRCVTIPQFPGERCLNLSTAAGIALYEALRKCGSSGAGQSSSSGLAPVSSGSAPVPSPGTPGEG